MILSEIWKGTETPEYLSDRIKGQRQVHFHFQLLTLREIAVHVIAIYICKKGRQNL